MRIHYTLNSTTSTLTYSNSKGNFFDSNSEVGMQTLHSRLQECGVKNYYFVKDENENDQLAPSLENPSLLVPVDPNRLILEDCVHVKTLIWKGSYFKNATIRDNFSDHKKLVKLSELEHSYSNNVRNSTFYFVTALKMSDKVDLKKLRHLVSREWPNQDGSLMLQLADRDQAELISGYVSGSIPPGWHNIPLKLFIDDGVILNPTEQNDQTVLENYEAMYGIGNGCNRYSRCIVSIGSGSSDYSLHVSLLDILQSSVWKNENAKLIHDHLDLDFEFPFTEYTRNICSFTRKVPSNNFNTSQPLSAKVTSVKIISSTYRSDGEVITNVTRRLFHATAKKKGKSDVMRAMIQSLGDDFVTFMNVESCTDDERFMSEFNKNALHYAAWKGDLETIMLLINCSKRYKKEINDVVNIISTGEGCYGKSPIFYAITQCRDDIVLFLISQGADLLIVNNKGQTPSSLAVNKLKPETCHVIFQKEESQMRSGRQFSDYRRSHSDNKRYGDLDPRFLTPGDINFGEDIIRDIKYYRDICNLYDDQERESIFLHKPYLRYGIQDLSLPRSVRVTTPIWRKESYIELQKLKQTFQAESNTKSHSAGKITKDILTMTDDSMVASDERSKTYNPIDDTELDIERMSVLRLDDVLPEGSIIEVVDDIAGIEKLRYEIEKSISLNTEDGSKDDLDHVIISTAWGLDCEWRPSQKTDDNYPVSTLQLSSSSCAFVIDLISFCRNDIRDLSIDLLPAEKLLSDTLSILFRNKATRILGFGISQDLSKLAASYPHMPCFEQYDSVVDILSISHRAYPKKTKSSLSSLQKSVAFHLFKTLDKTEQCSEWDLRPLTSSQIEYAALDAAVLPLLLSKMITKNPYINENSRFLSKEINFQISFRFTHFNFDDTNSYKVDMGSIKVSHMGRKFARQTWPTFKLTPPDLPKLMRSYDRETSQSNSDARKIITTKVKDTKKRDPAKNRNSAIDLTQLIGDLKGLPTPGQEIGYTKESCIMRVLRSEVMEALPQNSYLRYNRRGGVIEIGNAWLLFVNFGVGRSFHKYRNEFLQEGKLMTFTVNPGRFEDSELLQNLLISDNFFMYRKAVLLFIRGSTKDKFTYCGTVSHHSHDERDDLVNIVLKLNEFESLKVDEESGSISTYDQIVQFQNSISD